MRTREPTPEHVRISKHLSYVLRHAPEKIGITLDEAGWVSVDLLLERSRKHGKDITRAMLDEVVATSEKKRFALSEDGTRIRANQGHSVDVDLAYEPTEPPPTLFHGTPTMTVALVRDHGICKMGRHHVHLSKDLQTATTVASRRGRPAVLVVDSARMHADGHVFYVTPNGVWLTDHVPATYVTFPRA